MVVPKSSHDRFCSKESSQDARSTITISESELWSKKTIFDPAKYWAHIGMEGGSLRWSSASTHLKGDPRRGVLLAHRTPTATANVGTINTERRVGGWWNPKWHFHQPILDSRAASPLTQNVTSITHVLLVPATNKLDAQHKSYTCTVIPTTFRN